MRRLRPPLHGTVVVLGILSGVCWWQIRALGDVRTYLGAFYGWFSTAFLLYLAMLWRVRVAQHAPDAHRRSPLALGGLALAAIVFRLTLLPTPPVLSDDIYRYQWDGRVQRAGVDPYAYPPNAEALRFLRDDQSTRINFPHLRTVYPPLTEAAFRLGVWIGPTLTAQKIVFVCAEAVTFVSLVALLAARNLSPLWVAAYAWHPLVILEVAGSGHNDALGIACLWLGLAAWQRRRWFGSTAAWSAAFLSKFLSIILVPWWWFRRHDRRWLGLFLIMAALPLVAHPTAIRALVESLSAMTTRFESNASLYAMLAWLLGDASVARLCSTALWAGFLVWWGRRESDPVRYLLGGLAAAAVLSPVLHPWYLTWLVPCFCFWRQPASLALTGTVVLAYSVWPSYLAGGVWVVPLWARLLEYAPVLLLGVWEMRCVWRSSFRLVTKPALWAKS